MESLIVPIIVALITGACSIVGVIIATGDANRTIEQKLITAQAVTDTKLDNLTSEVRKHNATIDVVPKLEVRVTSLEKRVEKLEER